MLELPRPVIGGGMMEAAMSRLPLLRSGRRDRVEKPHRLRLLFRELKRRKVITVVVAYAVAAVAAIQIVDIVAPRMSMPGNTVSLVILMALAGLPVAAILAWLYDLVPDAVARRYGVPAAEPPGDATEEAGSSGQAAPAQWHAAALPTPATPFIGREDELLELRNLLCKSPARLVTVTGPGGVGKTRLALHTAHHVAASFRDGVVYRALSGLASSDLLVPSLAEALGIQLSRDEDPVVELEAFLHSKQLLIVLDNFEHLTSAAGLLPALLEHAPGVRMLVTSRECLNLQHETLVALDGLTLSGGDNEGDAEKLFVAGARRLDRHFQIGADNCTQVARICALLGGIPLAIELASSWVRALSCAEILAELERDLDILSNESPDLEERHHSLRATFDASWRLLSADEQGALARLAVFRSAFDRAAAGQVAGAVVPLLRQLVDKSLLTRTGDRLLMLDVVRTFALDRLTVDPDMERRARDRHLACFTTLLHTLHGSIQRADAAAIQRIADSIDDIRAAWSYATETNNAAALLRAMDGLFHFYEARGWAREGAEVFARSSAVIGDFSPQHDVPSATRLAAARLDVRHGVFLHRLGDLRSAESLLRRGVTAARELEEHSEIVFALHRLGAVRHGMGDYAESERLHHEAWLLAQQIGDRLAVGWSMTYLGNVAWSRGEFDTATRHYTSALKLLREEHDANGMWVTLNNMGVLAASREQYGEAQRRFREGIALQSGLKNPRVTAQGLHNLGNAALELGDFAPARKSLEESLEISERMGYQSMAGLTLVALAGLAIREEDQAGAETALQRALRTARAARNHPLALDALLLLARLRMIQGDTPGAVELAAVVARHPGSDRDVLRETSELFQEIGSEPPPQDGLVDLDALIDQITGGRPDAPATGVEAVARRHIMHAQPAGDT
jgi:predicted ATPase/Tfp pilus assembly protein PilF